MSTERPRNSSARPPRADPRTRFARQTAAPDPQRYLWPGLLSPSESTRTLLDCIFVRVDEVSNGNGEGHIGGGTEWVNTQQVFQPSYDDRQAQRIEPGIQERQIVLKRR